MSAPAITLVCFALKEEAAAFQKLLPAGAPAQITLVGIGRANAEKSLRARLAEITPAQVFTCGFAGGLDPTLTSGQVIFDNGYASPTLTDRLVAAGARPVKFYCADRIAITAAEKKALREQTGCDAVEMESEEIQKICRAAQIPCATIRVISDAAHEDLPLDFNALAKPDKSLDYARLALAVMRSPGKVPALKELQRQTTRAAENLAAVLQKIIFP